MTTKKMTDKEMDDIFEQMKIEKYKACDIAEIIKTAGNYYFRLGREDDFPWSTPGGEVWYALFISDGNIKYAGYTSAKSSKQNLIEAIEILNYNSRKYLLIGIWNGKYKPHLFVLDPKIAIRKLKKVV